VAHLADGEAAALDEALGIVKPGYSDAIVFCIVVNILHVVGVVVGIVVVIGAFISSLAGRDREKQADANQQ
jgi:uncharacterized membrane protein